MLHRLKASFSVVVALTLTLMLLLTACGGDEEPTPLPRAYRPQPVTVRTLPSPTPEPSETREPTHTPDPTRETTVRQIQLPADGDEVVVQFGRIENRPWQPEILAQMTPNLSLQANGYMVYQFGGGSSADGWYQTVLTPTLVTGFVKKLVDDIKVLEMADKLPPPKVGFATKADGTPDDPKAYGVIYVKTATDEGRLILTQEQIENPSGPYAANLKALQDLIRVMEFWRNTTEGSPTPEQKAAAAGVLGWWADPRQPYTPGAGLAFGTRAPSWVPADAPVAEWPLDSALDEAIDAKYGTVPSELAVAAEDVPTLIRAGREQPPSFWGSLWRMGRDGARYIVGLRPAVPGSNNVVIDDYAYTVPRQDVQPPAPSAPE